MPFQVDVVKRHGCDAASEWADFYSVVKEQEEVVVGNDISTAVHFTPELNDSIRRGLHKTLSEDPTAHPLTKIGNPPKQRIAICMGCSFIFEVEEEDESVAVYSFVPPNERTVGFSSFLPIPISSPVEELSEE